MGWCLLPRLRKFFGNGPIAKPPSPSLRPRKVANRIFFYDLIFSDFFSMDDGCLCRKGLVLPWLSCSQQNFSHYAILYPSFTQFQANFPPCVSTTCLTDLGVRCVRQHPPPRWQPNAMAGQPYAVVRSLGWTLVVDVSDCAQAVGCSLTHPRVCNLSDFAHACSFACITVWCHFCFLVAIDRFRPLLSHFSPFLALFACFRPICVPFGHVGVGGRGLPQTLAPGASATWRC